MIIQGRWPIDLRDYNFYFSFLITLFIYWCILAVLVLCHCMGFSLVGVSGGYSLVVLHRLLIMVTSLVVEQGLLEWAGFNSCGAWAQLVKNLPCNAGDLGSIPGLGRFPGEGNGYSLQYSCLENSMDRGAWQAIVHGVTKTWTWPSS